MSFVVSARKYRPQRFEDVVGQEHVTATLKNALVSDKLAHAFLFCGPRGVGKTTCARILAKVINMDDPVKSLEDGSYADHDLDISMNIFEQDGASNNSVENIRALIDQVRIPPQQGKYKIFIIDEVHMLSQAAFNAFLKTLEEPPPYAIFILATTEKHKILPTILSRCQLYDFRRIQVGGFLYKNLIRVEDLFFFGLIHEGGAVIRMGDFYQGLGAFPHRASAQAGHTILCDNHVHRFADAELVGEFFD